MRIDDEIVVDYLAGRCVAAHREKWFYRKAGYGCEEPFHDEETLAGVRVIHEQMRRILSDFQPCNAAIWDAIFPNWRQTIANVKVLLIVGYPEPNDATVMRDPEGEPVAILDLALWVKYLGKTDIGALVRNLLTHELCHVCIGETVPGIDDDLSSERYLDSLDANTFHEGFAHLVSFKAKEINAVDWNGEKLIQVAENCVTTMRRALAEQSPERQRQYLHDAIYGAYFDKFACMAGMFHLARRWQSGGIAALAEEFRAGYHGFARKTAGVKSS